MKQFWVIAGVVTLAACSQASDSQAPDAPAVESGQGAETVVEETSEAPEEVAALAQAAPVAAPMPATCTAEETPIFSCTVKGGKRLSVCGSNEGAVQYRFGGDDDAELVLDGGEFATVPYSGGGEAQIAFANGDTRYIVFSRVVRTNFKEGEPNNPAITDGVIVEKAGETVAQLSCGGEGELMPVQVFAAEEYLPRAGRLFTDAER